MSSRQFLIIVSSMLFLYACTTDAVKRKLGTHFKYQSQIYSYKQPENDADYLNCALDALSHGTGSGPAPGEPRKTTTTESLKDFQHAADDCSLVIKHNPENIDAHILLGEAFSRMGKYDQASQEFEKALGIKPDYDRVYNAMGNNLYRQEKFDDAIRLYNKAIELLPEATGLLRITTKPDICGGLAYYYYNRGRAQLLSNQPAEAIESFNRVADLGRKGRSFWFLKDTFFYRGWAKEKLEKYREAIADYKLCQDPLENQFAEKNYDADIAGYESKSDTEATFFRNPAEKLDYAENFKDLAWKRVNALEKPVSN